MALFNLFGKNKHKATTEAAQAATQEIDASIGVSIEEHKQSAVSKEITPDQTSQPVLVNLNRTLLFETFRNSLVTYHRCLSAAFLGCNTAYRLPHLASYAHALVEPL